MEENYYEEDYENPEDIVEIGCETIIKSEEDDEIFLDEEGIESDLY